MRAPRVVVVEYDGWIARHLGDLAAEGLLVSDGAAEESFLQEFVQALGEHRFWMLSRKNRRGPESGPDETRGRAPLPPAAAPGQPRIERPDGGR